MKLITERLTKLILDSLMDGGQYPAEYFVIKFIKPGHSSNELNEVLWRLEIEGKIRRFTLTNPITGVLTIYYEATSTI